MKLLNPFSKLLLALIVINAIAFEQVYSQTKDITQDLAWKRPVAFIENKGQFDNRNWQSSVVEYAVDHNSFRIFFAKDGLTYRFDKFIRCPKEDRKVHEPKRTNVSELVTVSWLNSNPNVEIIASNKFDAYFSYAIYDRDKDITTNENHIDGYQKLVYKNLYDNIDVEYEIHQGQGIKYNIILHPGADISQIQMKYEAKHTNIENEQISIELDNQDQIVIKSSLGEIKESSPVAFSGANLQEVPVHYHFENNILSFVADEYDKSQIFIIDPWIVSATFNTSGAAWEVETDAAGNVYVIGGETPMRLDKYNSAGALQWSYNTPWDTAGYWLGTLATDLTGTSFITAGTSPRIQRINTSGGMVWNNTGYNATCEYWTITFNCDHSRLIVGGTYVPGIFSFDYSSAIYNINITNGSVISFQTFDTVTIGFVTPIEVRSISASKNAKYMFLTHNHVGQITQNVGACPSSVPYYKINNGHTLAYKCENYLPATQNGGGLKAITSNDLYVYTHSGSQIHQRDLSSGALIRSVNLPGGSSYTSLGRLVVRNSGLDVDDCGNVYAGSGDRVVKYDQDLNFISEAMTTSGFTVYDVSVNSNGEVIAVGAVHNNSQNIRSGYIQSLNMSTCGQYVPECCDATICPLSPICDTDPAFNLTPSAPGGTWSGTGITNTTNGTFDPSVSGTGTFWVYYTVACGTDSVLVTVNLCNVLSVCKLTNGDLSVTGGTPPYTWQQWSPTTINCNNSANCTACGGTWFFFSCMGGTCPCTVYNWSTFATGDVVSPPANWPVRVFDSFGNELILPDYASIADCTLPVDLIEFKGEIQKNSNLLSWSTASEINNHFFILERSENAIDFIALSRINGAGNTNVITTYLYEDTNPLTFGYYRLKQVDFDGKYSYSDVLYLDRTGVSSIFNVTIWPNPANTQVNVCYHISNNGKVEAELMDATGRIVLKEQYDSRSGLNHEILNISGLANGIYILNLSSNGTSSKFRIVKN